MRMPLFRPGLTLFSCFTITAALACGGGTGAGSGTQTPGASGSSADSSSTNGGSGNENSTSDGSKPAGGDEATGGATTTTTQLGKGGDLQGAKLGDSVHTTTETKGEGGPKSTHGQSANEPGRSMKDIQALVVARRDEARACYDKGLAAHPGIKGDLDVKWVIDPQGNVTDASVDTTKSDILEPSVGACVVDVIKKIKFATSAKGYETRAHYPFNFQPKNNASKDSGK